MASNANGKPATAPATAYETAIEVATDEEKERLQALRLRLNIPPDSPEWQFYALLAPLTASASTEKTFAAFAEQLDRIEQVSDDLKTQAASTPGGGRLDGIDAKLQTIERLSRTSRLTNGAFGIARDIGCFLAGMVAGLLIVHLMLGQRVDSAWLVAGAGALGAAIATAVLWLAPRIEDAISSR